MSGHEQPQEGSPATKGPLVGRVGWLKAAGWLIIGWFVGCLNGLLNVDLANLSLAHWMIVDDRHFGSAWIEMSDNQPE